MKLRNKEITQRIPAGLLGASLKDFAGAQRVFFSQLSQVVLYVNGHISCRWRAG